jgi:hypothetical protein
MLTLFSAHIWFCTPKTILLIICLLFLAVLVVGWIRMQNIPDVESISIYYLYEQDAYGETPEDCSTVLLRNNATP